jgi:type II secretory pathway pseudopilin PulG
MIRRKSQNSEQTSESGMSLIAILGMMTIFAISLLAIAPTVQLEVQREKELEAIRRGEEVAEAIKQYVTFHRGTKLPNSIDELLEGLPQGTKKRQILRPSAAIDPLSEDGQWRLITSESQAFLNFAKRVQIYNNGALPSSPQPTLMWDKYSVKIFANLNTGTDSKSVLSYYGIENHSKWVFTPMFRGTGAFNTNQRPPPPPPPDRPNQPQIP